MNNCVHEGKTKGHQDDPLLRESSCAFVGEGIGFLCVTSTRTGPAGKIARTFLGSKLTPLIIAASILLGVGAVLLLPREEEPQIVVPMIDVFVQMPGASAKEVEERVTKPMEKLLWEIPGVEYIYSTSSPGYAMAVVRFYVGQNEEAAHRPAESEDVGQLRSDSARRQPAADQAALD